MMAILFLFLSGLSGIALGCKLYVPTVMCGALAAWIWVLELVRIGHLTPSGIIALSTGALAGLIGHMFATMARGPQ